MANGAILGQTAPTPTAQEVTVQQSTAQQFGLTGDATVDQVLQILKNAAVVNSAGTALETVLGSTLLTIPGVRIATGSYVGTGTYGSSNPNSLTFDEPPILFTFLSTSNGQIFGYIPWPTSVTTQYAVHVPMLTTSYESEYALRYGASSAAYAKRSEDSKTIYWYTSNAASQYNDDGTTYYYAYLTL